jgi:hypothetical protein
MGLTSAQRRRNKGKYEAPHSETRRNHAKAEGTCLSFNIRHQNASPLSVVYFTSYGRSLSLSLSLSLEILSYGCRTRRRA